MYHDVVIAGFGGQGVLFIGNLLAEAGMDEGFHVTFMPAYGVEMRGGTANCNVIVSSEEVGSPITDSPLTGIIMNEASLMRFLPSIQKDGFLFYNSSLIPEEAVSRNDIQVVPVPANDLALKVGHASHIPGFGEAHVVAIRLDNVKRVPVDPLPELEAVGLGLAAGYNHRG